jgi:hypothetical protein
VVERPVFSCGVASTELSMTTISPRPISGDCLTKRRDSEGREPGLSPCIRHAFAMLRWHSTHSTVRHTGSGAQAWQFAEH